MKLHGYTSYNALPLYPVEGIPGIEPLLLEITLDDLQAQVFLGLPLGVCPSNPGQIYTLAVHTHVSSHLTDVA